MDALSEGIEAVIGMHGWGPRLEVLHVSSPVGARLFRVGGLFVISVTTQLLDS